MVARYELKQSQSEKIEPLLPEKIMDNRGENACQKLLLEELGQDIYHLEGGIAQWKE